MKNKYRLVGEVVLIEINISGSKEETQISLEDFNKVNSIKGSWWGIVDPTGIKYVRHFSKDTGTLFLHRFIMDVPKNKFIDHIDGNGLNNQRNNLRIVTPQQNSQNITKLRSDNKSGVRGVTWFKSNMKWKAYITVKGKQIHLGYFDNIKDAEKTVKKARKELLPYSTN